jgi:hypothetical protein
MVTLVTLRLVPVVNAGGGSDCLLGALLHTRICCPSLTRLLHRDGPTERASATWAAAELKERTEAIMLDTFKGQGQPY